MKRLLAVLFVFIMVFSSCLPLIEPITMSDTPTTLDVTKNITLPVGATVDGVDISTIAGAAHAQNTDTNMGVLAVKPLALDGDKFVIRDSAAGDVFSTTTGAQLKTYVGGHTQNTDWTLKDSAGGASLIHNGYFVSDIRTDRWMSNDSNTFFGVDAAGHGSLSDAGGGSEATGNTGIGSNAQHKISTGYYNTGVGNMSQIAITTGIGNTALGENSLASITTTNFNTSIGTDSLWQNTGSYNTALGMNTGASNLTGNSNVLLGYAAGQNELGSNKLYIANSADTTPLIYGDFSTDTVTINTTLSMAGNITMVGGATVDGVDVSTLSGSTNPFPDDTVLGFGTGTTTSFLWETADANANAMVIALPDGGATDVPVLVIGDQSVINKDLGFFQTQTVPAIVVMSGDETLYLRLRNNSIISNAGLFVGSNNPSGVVSFISRNNYAQYLNYDVTASNVPTLYGTGAYLRVGDAATTGATVNLASEDDLLISGKTEHYNAAYFQNAIVFAATGQQLTTSDVDNYYFLIRARDNGVARVEVGRVTGAADPYFQIGRNDTGVATNAVTDMLVLQAGAGANNTAINFGLGTSWKLGNAASEVEERGSIDLVLTTATNGAEASKFVFATMSAGSMVNPALSLAATTTTTTLTAANDMTLDTGASKTVVLGQPPWDDLQVNMSTAKAPASSSPTWTSYLSSEVPAFSKTATNVLYFSAQLPHAYKEGTDLDFHIHIAYPDNGAGNSIWYFTYSWANIDAAFPAASNSGNKTVASPTTANLHDMEVLITPISGAGKTVSSVLLCSISRLGGDGSDSYDNVIYLVSCDFHYQKDTIGSRSRLTK
jgi:hypothetical protein